MLLPVVDAFVPVAVAVLVPEPVPEAARPFPIVLVVVQDEVGGAGCAAGVEGSPWWNVEVP